MAHGRHIAVSPTDSKQSYRVTRFQASLFVLGTKVSIADLHAYLSQVSSTPRLTFTMYVEAVLHQALESDQAANPRQPCRMGNAKGCG
jgi:hypothetical protein